MVEDFPTTSPAFRAAPSDDDPKRRKKEAKLQAQPARPLDPWERYRALVDSLEEAQDLVELADRKARFALVIMGALNIAFFFLATRVRARSTACRGRCGPSSASTSSSTPGSRSSSSWRRSRRSGPGASARTCPTRGRAGPDHFPEGLRYYEDIVLRDLEAYRRAWREVRFGQLNAELAVQNHIMARINLDKFRSLRRLYGGLRVLTILAGGLLASWRSRCSSSSRPRSRGAARTRPGRPRARPARRRRAEARASAHPMPCQPPGVREASGIAWHAVARALLRRSATAARSPSSTRAGGPDATA